MFSYKLTNIPQRSVTTTEAVEAVASSLILPIKQSFPTTLKLAIDLSPNYICLFPGFLGCENKHVPRLHWKWTLNELWMCKLQHFRGRQTPYSWHTSPTYILCTYIVQSLNWKLLLTGLIVLIFSNLPPQPQNCSYTLNQFYRPCMAWYETTKTINIGSYQ